MAPGWTCEQPQFAERLSVLSIQWSHNFSREECLALAESLCSDDDDTPGIMTIESFTAAVEYGIVTSQSLSQVQLKTASEAVGGDNRDTRVPRQGVVYKAVDFECGGVKDDRSASADEEREETAADAAATTGDTNRTDGLCRAVSVLKIAASQAR